MDLSNIPQEGDPLVDPIQAAVLAAGKTGAVQAFAVMAKVGELLGQQSPYTDQERLDRSAQRTAWMKACAALTTISSFLQTYAQRQPARSVETGQVDEQGQPIEQVLHLDPETLAQVIATVLEGCKG